MSEDPVAVLSNKQELIARLGKISVSSSRAAVGLNLFVEAIKEGKTGNQQLGQMVSKISEVLAKECEANKMLSIVLLAYVSSSTFDKDVADLTARQAAKNGHAGHESVDAAQAHSRFNVRFDPRNQP